LEAEKTVEKPSAFIQEVAGRKPQDTKKLPTPMKKCLAMKMNLLTVFSVIHYF